MRLVSTSVELGICPGLTRSPVALQLSPALHTLPELTLPLLAEGHFVPPQRAPWPAHGADGLSIRASRLSLLHDATLPFQLCL